MTVESATPRDGSRGYVSVAGRPVWHERHGDGEPVVLLHGAFSGASSWHGQLEPLLAAGFRVHAPERSGHAHTPDSEPAFSYQGMAEETIAYLDAIVGEPSHLVGWSDGAVVAVLVAFRRPDLVRRMVLIGQYLNSEGKTHDGLVDQLTAAGDAAMDFLRPEYDEVSPDGPRHFSVVFAKTMQMIRSGPELDLTDLSDIASETLVLQGDRDDVTLAHGAAVAAALTRGRLAVLPGTHALPLESPKLVGAVLVSWLRDGVGQAPWASSSRGASKSGE